MTKSFTRFVVEGTQHWDTAEQALACAKTMVYFSAEKEAEALDRLKRGESVTLVYGFSSVLITAPAGSGGCTTG